MSPNNQSGIALVTVLVFLLVIAALVALRGGEELGEIHLAAADAEVRRLDYVAQAGMQRALWQVERNSCLGDFNIAATNLGGDQYSATATGAAAGTVYTLASDQDAWVRSDQADTNNGTTAGNHVKFDTGKFEQVLTRFDLSALPVNARINSAVAWFYIRSSPAGAHPEGAITAHPITADWGETTVTWNNFAGSYETGVVAKIPAQDNVGAWVSINITGQVQAWVNGLPNFGILFDSVSEGLHTEYTSREDGSSPPRLEVVVGAGSPSPLNIQATGTLANGQTRDLIRPTAAAYQPPGSMSLQLGVDPGEDAMPDSFYSTRNYGGASYIQVNDDGSNWQQYPLIRFELAGLPRGATVQSAQLELSPQSLVAPGTATVHQVTRSWVEGTKSGTGQADGSTWFTRDGSNAWTSAGGDFNASAVAEAAINGGETWVSWDITSLVERWLAGEPNYGLMLRPANGLREAAFSSKEDSTVGVAPKLTITYACECGSACMAPQGSGNILLVVDSKTNPVPGDQLLQAMLESWGYTVKLIAEEAAQNSYNVEMGSHDVVFISESVSAGTLGAKVSAAPIGVVSAEGLMNSQLGIATGRGTPVGDTIDVVDASHYITAVFPAGPLKFKTAATELAAVSGSVSPDAQVLAGIGGTGSLVALEAGALAASGGNVTSRRVLLPTGDAEASWNYLTNNGQLVVQRAIAWAKGVDAFSIGNLLMVVVNDGILTSQEGARKVQLETWGYTVSVIDQDNNQAEFNTALVGQDVVYITEDVSSTAVGTKLLSATIGVVTEEDNLSDDFGLSDGIHWGSGTSLTINDNSHYITSPFGLGPLSVLNTSTSLSDLTGSLAPDLQILGSASAGPAMATIEAGATLVGGGTAAGRRVQLPWGGNPMELGFLTPDGLTIFQRALEWGSGLSVSGPLAHWKMDETSGLVAVDSIGGHDGTLANGPAWTTGQLDGGLDFDGTNDTVGAGSDAAIDDVFAGGATLTGWIYPRAWGGGAFGRIADKADALGTNRNGWAFELYGSPRALLFQYGFSGAIGNWYTPTDSIALDTWQHVAVVYDNSADTNDPLIYIDGVAQSLTELDTPVGTASSDAAVDLTLGNYSQATSRAFDGVLDDIRFYDRMLSVAEIAELAVPAAQLPIAHWKLDETSGTTADDTVGPNDGALLNGPSWTPGTIDGGLHFDGTNDRVDAGTFDVTGSGLTLMGWFNADALPDAIDPRLVSKASSTAEADAWWQLSILTTGGNANIRLRTKAGGTTSTLIDSSTNLSPGQWYFAVGTYDAATGEMKLYLDGAEVASQSHPVGGAVDTNAGVPVALGANGTAEQFFDGVLDDLRVYDQALSASEIADFYAAGGGGGGGGPTTTFEVRVATGTDDAEESVSTGNVNLSSSDLELISDGSNAQLVGMRFANMTVPNGASIANAYIQFQVDELNSGATNVIVQGQAINDAPTFAATNSNISSRSQTTAAVPWVPVAWGTVGEAGADQRTPDLSAVIQEIVDRPGWNTGNDIVIIITGSGERTAESYNGVAAAAPLLHIEY